MTIDLKRALVLLDLLDPANKYETMLRTAAILTKLLEQNNVKPIIVGGFSVEIYTNRDYSTYDIDIVTSDIVTVANILEKLGFIKEGRHFYHERLKIAIEFPDEPFALQIFSASLAKKAAMYFAWSCLNKPACSDVYQFIRNMR